MAKKTEDTFPYAAIADLASLCHEDYLITERAKFHAHQAVLNPVRNRVTERAEFQARQTVLNRVRNHVQTVAERYDIPADVIARMTGSVVGPNTVMGEYLFSAVEPESNDFRETATRMGYATMVKATTVFTDEPRIEVGLARNNWNVNQRWTVIEHIGTDPDRPDRGSSGVDDYTDFAEALQVFEETVEKYRQSVGMKM